MDLVDYFLVNEIEGKEISGAETEEPEIVMEGLKKKFPNAAVVLTLGDKGSWYFARDLKDGQCGQRHRGQQKRRRTEHSDV